MHSDLALVVVGGGRGTRFGRGNKLFAELGGLPLFCHALARLGGEVPPGGVVMVAPGELIPEFGRLAAAHLPDLAVRFVAGGAERSDSVLAGLAAVPEFARYVAVHDAARPFASAKLLGDGLAAARRIGGAVPGHPVTDTVKETDGELRVTATPDRGRLYAVATPQVFELARLREAYRLAAGRRFTDDAAVLEAAGFPVAVVPESECNLKITRPDDLDYAAYLIARRPEWIRAYP